jgi:hypothetical protein
MKVLGGVEGVGERKVGKLWLNTLKNGGKSLLRELRHVREGSPRKMNHNRAHALSLLIKAHLQRVNRAKPRKERRWINSEQTSLS